MLGEFQVKGQELDNANLNLSSGGYINDVVYDEWHDVYIIVGNFTSVNGFSRKNIACLDGTTLAVETLPHLIPITNIDGEIRTVDITRTLNVGFYTYHLFIGGNFQTITIGATNYTRKGVAKLISTQTTTLPITHTNYSVSVWNADLDMGAYGTGVNSDGVDDILIKDDTVMIAGRFIGASMSTSYEARNGLVAFTVSGTSLNYPAVAQDMFYLNARYYCLYHDGTHFYAGGYVNNGGPGNARLIKLDALGNSSFVFNWSEGSNRAVYSISVIDDSLLAVGMDNGSENSGPDKFGVVSMANGSDKVNHSIYPFTDGHIGNAVSGVNCVTAYEDRVYAACTEPGKIVTSIESAGDGPFVTSLAWNANVTAALTQSLFGTVHVAANKLFISAPNLTTLSGQSRLRLGAYCLPPKNSNGYAVFVSDVCPLQVENYGIELSEFADGYRWEYSGIGVDFGNNGTIDSGPIDMDGLSTNAQLVAFKENATSGTLTVTPYSYCNGTTKLFADPVSIQITVNPIPNVFAGNDTSITCYTELTGITLTGHTDSLNVTDFVWDYPSVLDDDSSWTHTVNQPGPYYFLVKNSYGCINRDTVVVGMDTLHPSVILPAPPYEFTCIQTDLMLDGSTSFSDCELSWVNLGTNDTFPDPYLAQSLGSYKLIVQDTMNGCTSENSLMISSNFIVPQIALTGYASIPLSSALETLTCDNDTLNLETYSPTPNSSAEWTDEDQLNFFGSNLEITQPGFYYLLATESTTGCTNSLTILIEQNTSTFLYHAPDDDLLNCSTDSLILDADSPSFAAEMEWTGSGISPSSDPLTIYNPGVYYIEVFNPQNGCSSIDSVVITQDNSITLDAGPDVLICDQEIVNLQVDYSGTISGITYLWDNGSTLANANYIGGQNLYAAVQVSGDGGCIGFDTVWLNLPPIPEVEFQGFKPCDDGASGQIVATPMSGYEPFLYSIDAGLTFQSSPVFTGLSVGTYPITVKDSVGCDYPFTGVIDENSSLPVPSFLLSTYNYETDTVVIVDVSNPPADSVNWIVPLSLNVLEETENGIMVLLPDTGSFAITMSAYFGSCNVELTKLIYASPFDSLAATNYNQNGIKSLVLYPNPTNGNFTVDVEFFKSQRSQVAVKDMLGTTYFYDSFEEEILLSVPVNLDASVVDGTYVFYVISEFDSATITFVLAH